jgi:hypothetical protein
MSDFNQAWFVIPKRIMDLDGLTMAFLRVYETIFQFWNNDKPCYLSNKMIMERTGIKSERTIQDAFTFFEQHNELVRKDNKGKRYLVQPTRYVELEPEKLSTEEPLPPAENCGAPPQRTAGPPRRELRDNNNKINTNNLNKSFCDSKNKQSVDNSKKHSWANTPPSGFADVNNQSTSYQPCEVKKDTAGKNYQEMLNSNPYLKHKRTG